MLCMAFFFFLSDNLQSQETTPSSSNKKDDKATNTNNNSVEELLKSNSGNSFIYQKLYDWLVISKDSNISTNELIMEFERENKKYNQRVIRSIKIKQVSPFSKSILDTIGITTNDLEKTLTKLRFSTRKSIITNTLTFKKGEYVNIQDIMDSERILRSLNFITDAIIIIEPANIDSTLVDVLVISQDNYPYGANLSINANESNFQVYSRNVLGFGMGLSHSINTAPTANKAFGFQERLNWNNIYGSYISFNMDYSDIVDSRFFSIGANKKFLVPETKYAGGFEIKRNYKIETISQKRNNIWNNNFDYLFQDFWLGRAYLIDAPNYFNRSNIGIMGQVMVNDYYNLPDSLTSVPNFSQNLYLFSSISFSKQNYYKNSLIFNYGKTEDVPHGFLSSISFGYNHNVKKNRLYTGAHFSFGMALIPNKGYFYLSGDLNSFIFKRNFEETTSKIQGRYISSLIPIGRSDLRTFISFNYVSRSNAQTEMYLFLNQKNNGLTSYNSSSLKGTEKLILKTENVVFTPSEFIGFRTAIYSFIDMAWISQQKNIFNRKPFYSFGAGIRIKNDHLVFNTIQIQLAYFPRIPPGGANVEFRFSGEESGNFRQFNVQKPYVDIYK